MTEFLDGETPPSSYLVTPLIASSTGTSPTSRSTCSNGPPDRTKKSFWHQEDSRLARSLAQTAGYGATTTDYRLPPKEIVVLPSHHHDMHALNVEGSSSKTAYNGGGLNHHHRQYDQYNHDPDEDDDEERTLALGEHSEDPFESHVSSKISMLPLAVMVFYSVSGGPFGVEASVRSAGNFYTLLGFLIMPWIWSVQEALMTAELGTAFPEASGGVAWVETAFGTSAGWMAGYLGWVAGTTLSVSL